MIPFTAFSMAKFNQRMHLLDFPAPTSLISLDLKFGDDELVSQGGSGGRLTEPRRTLHISRYSQYQNGWSLRDVEHCLCIYAKIVLIYFPWIFPHGPMPQMFCPKKSRSCENPPVMGHSNKYVNYWAKQFSTCCTLCSSRIRDMCSTSINCQSKD